MPGHRTPPDWPAAATASAATTTYVFPVNGGTRTSVVQHVGILSGK